MKRFILFIWDNYYPLGGMNDFKGCFDNLESAVELADSCIEFKDCEHYQIYDTHDMKVVKAR